MNIEIQSKFYKKSDSQHAEWGSNFHGLEIEYHPADSPLGIADIDKVTYR